MASDGNVYHLVFFALKEHEILYIFYSIGVLRMLEVLPLLARGGKKGKKLKGM